MASPNEEYLRLLERTQVPEDAGKIGLAEILGMFGKDLLGVANLPGGLIKGALLGALRGGGYTEEPPAHGGLSSLITGETATRPTPTKGMFNRALEEMVKVSESGGKYTPELENPWADIGLGFATDPYMYIGGGSIPKMAKWGAKKLGWAGDSFVGPMAKKGEAAARNLETVRHGKGWNKEAPQRMLEAGTEEAQTVGKPMYGIPRTRVGTGQRLLSEPAKQLTEGPKLLPAAREVQLGGVQEPRRFKMPAVSEAPSVAKTADIAPEVLDVVEHMTKPTTKTVGSYGRGEQGVEELANKMVGLMEKYNLVQGGKEAAISAEGPTRVRKFKAAVQKERNPYPGYVKRRTPTEEFVASFLRERERIPVQSLSAVDRVEGQLRTSRRGR